MSQLDDLAAEATASPVVAPPSTTSLRQRVRRRTRNTVATVVAAGVVVAGATFGIAAAASSGSSSRSIVATPGPDDVVPTTGTSSATFVHLIPGPEGTVSRLGIRPDGGGEMLFDQGGCSYSLRFSPSSKPADYIGVPITVRGESGVVLGMGNIAWYHPDGGGYGLQIDAQDVKPVAEQCDPQPVAETLVEVDATAWNAFVVSLGGRVTLLTPPTSQPSKSVPLTEPTTTTTSPPSFEGEKAAVADMITRWGSRLGVDESVALIEDGEALRDTISAVNASQQVQAAKDPNILIRSIELVGDDHAIVTFDIRQGDKVTLPNQTGGAVKIDGVWHLSRDTYCRIALNVQVTCPEL